MLSLSLDSVRPGKAMIPTATCEQCGAPDANLMTYLGRLCAACEAKIEKRCDFCSATPIWEYPVRSFDFTLIEGRPESVGSKTDWLACQDCYDLIEANRWIELAKKSEATSDHIVGWEQMNKSHNFDPQVYLRRLHQAFRDHRDGKPFQIATGKPPKRSGHADYMRAIEKRAAWLAWAKTYAGQFHLLHWDYDLMNNAPVVRRFIDLLEHGDTFFMDAHFCQLVDHARRTMPEETKFEVDWMIRPHGWLWLAEPFEAPRTASPDPKTRDRGKNVCAVSWKLMEQGERVLIHNQGALSERRIEGREMWFACFVEDGQGFCPYAYFTIRDGQSMSARVKRFETDTSPHDMTLNFAELHEIRWIYAAMHLMSQRLAAKVRTPTDRATRKRVEREHKRAAPQFIDVVTLRRLQQDREHDPKGKEVDWQWHWAVRGHWRSQWYPSEGVHKPTFVESYIKGDLSKPFKQATKVFVATR